MEAMLPVMPLALDLWDLIFVLILGEWKNKQKATQKLNIFLFIV